MNNQISLTAREWCNLLWDEFIPIIDNGEPLYLTIDGFLLKTLIEKNLKLKTTLEIASSSFISSCNELYVNFYDHVSISYSVWEKDENNRTLALCLAAQQILAVEQMYGDNIYTQNAYFPRYRKILGIEENKSSCPMRQYDFQNIWNQLRKEILDIEGANVRTITFKQGDSLRDKNRAFPLSQALLDRQDIQEIFNLIPNISSLDDNSLFYKIQRLRHNLTARSVNVLYNTNLKEKIIKQIRNYENYNKNIELVKKSYKEREKILGKFVIYMEEDGWDQIYCLYYINEDRQYKDHNLEENLDNHFNSNNRLILKEERDRFEWKEGKNIIWPGDEFILIEKKQSNTNNKETLEIGGEILQIKTIEYSIPDGYFLTYFSAYTLSNPIIFDGVDNRCLEKKLNAIKLYGGMLIDARQNKYLIGYPPDCIEYDGSILHDNEYVTLNKQKIKHSEFKLIIRLCADSENYLLEYRNNKILFEICRPDCTSNARIGYKFYSKENIIEPIAKKMFDETDQYFGFLQSHNISLKIEYNIEQKIFDYGRYAYTPTEKWMHVSNKDKYAIIKELEKVKTNKKDIYMLKRQISALNKIPSILYSFLRKEKII